MREMNILYEDKDLVVVVKPAGIASQSSKGMEEDMVSLLKKHYASEGKGEPYIGVIHRLDTMVSGVMVYARNKETAAALSAEAAGGLLSKKYIAVTAGQPAQPSGTLTDWLIKAEGENTSSVTESGRKGAKKAELRYRTVLKRYLEGERIARLEIELLTGRHHQIRVQLSHAGCPVLGDRRYGGDASRFCARYPGQLALASTELSFTHPKTRKRMTYTHKPEGGIWELV